MGVLSWTRQIQSPPLGSSLPREERRHWRTNHTNSQEHPVTRAGKEDWGLPWKPPETYLVQLSRKLWRNNSPTEICAWIGVCLMNWRTVGQVSGAEGTPGPNALKWEEIYSTQEIERKPTNWRRKRGREGGARWDWKDGEWPGHTRPPVSGGCSWDVWSDHMHVDYRL